MEFNKTTENVNIAEMFFFGNINECKYLKLTKNNQFFFHDYSIVEICDIKSENIIKVDFETFNRTINGKSPLILVVVTNNNQRFQLIFLPDGRLIDTRKIKLKESQGLFAYVQSTSTFKEGLGEYIEIKENNHSECTKLEIVINIFEKEKGHLEPFEKIIISLIDKKPDFPYDVTHGI